MIGSLKTVAFDAADIAGLAAFYQAFAGWEQAYADDEWVTLTTPDGWRIGLQLAPDHTPPRWPDPAYPQQAHLDLRAPDVTATTARAVELGATLLRENERWNTLADPAGHPFDVVVKEDNPGITVMGVMLDCPDPATMSAFYAELLGKPVTYQDDGMAMIGEDGAHPVLFQQVQPYLPPRWPDPAHPQQVHLDVLVEHVKPAEQAALAIGATRLPGDGENWRVYADPAGKPFCLVWNA